MAFEKTYIAVNSPSFGHPSNPSNLAANSAPLSCMTPPMMPIVTYPGHPMMMATLSPQAALSPRAPPAPKSLIDKNNPPPRRTGVCKFFNVGKGFGFIKDSKPEELPLLHGDPGTDIFVHYSCIVSCDAPYKSLLDGEPVEYYLGRSNKGLAALEITGPGGANVKGCMNSRSPTVLAPMPTFTAPFGMVALPGSFAVGHAPGASPITSPAFSYNGMQASAAWSIPMPGVQKLTLIPQSPQFALAVGMPLAANQHVRRETTECLASPNLGSGTKMARMSSTPISAPGFASPHLKSRETAGPTNLGVGIGIGVHWEPKSRGQAPQWSPPGGPEASLREFPLGHPAASAGRRTKDASTDRTKSNWRSENILGKGTTLETIPDGSVTSA